jgi:hypothetical protein
MGLAKIDADTAWKQASDKSNTLRLPPLGVVRFIIAKSIP